MDPRLWHLLNLNPGALYIRQIQLDQEANILTLRCEAVTEMYPKGKTFDLRFDHCRDIHWQAMTTHFEPGASEAVGIFLGEGHHHKPAVFYTGVSEMSVLYEDLDVRPA